MLKMPRRKEVKETVVYPSSKRKPPLFKPQRPSKVPPIPTTESESSMPKPAKKSAVAFTNALKKGAHKDDEDEDEDESDKTESVRARAALSDSDDELEDDPLAAKPKGKKPSKPPPAAKKKKQPPQRDKSPMSISSDEPCLFPPPPADVPPSLSQLSDPTQIPQLLLIRLLHEHFSDDKTKIDKHAIQVVQKYMEVFVREAIARTAMQKREVAEKGGVDDADAGWLELEDLEKVAPGMMLDF